MIATDKNPWLSHPVLIERITPKARGVNTYDLRFADVMQRESFVFQPGQFNMLYLPGCGEVAISLSADPAAAAPGAYHPAGGQCYCRFERIGRRRVARFAWPLWHALATRTMRWGRRRSRRRRTRNGPLASGCLSIVGRQGAVWANRVALGARTPDGLLFAREFPAWQAGSLQMQTTVDRYETGWPSNVGTVPLLLERLTPLEPANTQLLICGPEVMMQYTVCAALQRGLKKGQIWLSLERNMQCAVGMCGHCQARTGVYLQGWSGLPLRQNRAVSTGTTFVVGP